MGAGVGSPFARRTPEECAIATEERYRLGSLGDLIEMVVDGWQVEALHYADDCALAPDDDHLPAAFIELTRPDQGRYGLYIPDDGRAFSHRALISLFRECPHIWKHRSAERIHQMAADVPMATPHEQDTWGDVVEPFPGALIFSPGTLRGVVAIDQTDSVDDVTVALTVLERFQDGARLRFMAYSPDPRRRKRLSLLEVRVQDDHDRTYRAELLDVRRDGNRVEGALAIAPAIPRDVDGLTVTIGMVGDPKKTGDALKGPWTFPFQVTQPAPTSV